MDDGHDADVHRPDRRRVVVDEPDDPRLGGRRQDELLVELAPERVVDDVGTVLGVHVPAHSHRQHAVEPPLAAAVRPLAEEDPVVAHDHRVGDHLLERRILLHAVALREEAARVDAPEELRPRPEEAVRRPVGEEVPSRHDVDALAHRRASGSRAT